MVQYVDGTVNRFNLVFDLIILNVLRACCYYIMVQDYI